MSITKVGNNSKRAYVYGYNVNGEKCLLYILTVPLNETEDQTLAKENNRYIREYSDVYVSYEYEEV